MNAKRDKDCEEMILRFLYAQPSREAILVPTMFSPPILLTNIQRLAGDLKKKGYTSGPDRRMGGWHLRLLAPGVAYCQGAAVPA
jgi:hypothetical protein